MECPKCKTVNPADSKFCKECATPLPSAKDIPDSRTETVNTPLKELTTGSTFAGRYKIIEELGAGGMGRVYKVQDTDIKEKVALKLLRPEITLDKEAVERFSNELKLARKISHRNVCRMFDLGRAEGTTFITMEFVPGEDLKSFIHRSKQLSIGTAISIAKQVCEGLEEAHRLGVVHRDLKPGNVMIDKDGDAKIMDFGIARSLSGRGITGAGVMIGTPEYMSPEQVEGKDIDQRSDLYSLGVILYEMVTGRLPFAGDTPLSVAHKQKYEAPEDPKKLNTQIPDDLSWVILKCLAKDRDKRFQSAAELGAELGRIEDGLPTTDRLVAERKTTSASGRPTLAVLYFENMSGDPKLDNWRDALAELLITSLQQSRYISVISGDEMYTILKRLGLADARKYSSEDIEKIVAQTRATYVLRGSFIKAGESFIITAGLQKPGASEGSTPLRLEASNEKEIIAKVDELTRQVKEGLNLSAAQIANDVEKEAGTITTSSPEALKYYIEGRKHQLNDEWEQSIAYMEKAVEKDPEFAMAFRTLATAHGDLGHRTEFWKYAKKALELSVRLPDNEKLFIEGWWLRFNQDFARAIEVLERLLRTYPNHLPGLAYLAQAYNGAGDINKAIKLMELFIQKGFEAADVQQLAGYYLGAGLYQKAEDVCRSYLQNIGDSPGVRQDLVYSYICRRQFDLALAEAEKNSLLHPSTKWQLGAVFLYKDDLAAAEKILGSSALLLIRGKFNENVSLSRQNLEKSKGNIGDEAGAYGGLAIALEKAGRYQEAAEAEKLYLKLLAEYRKSAGESGLVYLPAEQKTDLFYEGIIQANANSLEDAQKTVGQLQLLINQGINTNELRFCEYVTGLIELRNKNSRKAVDAFSSAVRRYEATDKTGNNYALYVDGLARALFESGDLDKARGNYERITLLTLGRLDHGDIYARAYYMLGKIAEQQGDKPRALVNYHKFLDLWKDADAGLPEVADAKARLAALS